MLKEFYCRLVIKYFRVVVLSLSVLVFSVKAQQSNFLTIPSNQGLETLLNQTIIPNFSIQEVTFSEAIFSFRLAVNSSWIRLKPLNLLLRDSLDEDKQIASKVLSLDLQNVTAKFLLDSLCKKVGGVFEIQDYAVVISTFEDRDNPRWFKRKTWKLSLGFLQWVAAQELSTVGELFADGKNGSSTLDFKAVLERLGIKFPEGSHLVFFKKSKVLSIFNSVANLALIDELVQNAAEVKQNQILLNVKVITSTENKLNELGFDWTVGKFLGSTSRIDGGTYGAFGTNVEPASFSNPDAIIQPITAGTRATSPGILAVINVYRQSEVQALLRGISQNTSSDEVISGSILVKSGKRADFRRATQFWYANAFSISRPSSTSRPVLNIFGHIVIVASRNPALVNLPIHPSSFVDKELGFALTAEANLAKKLEPDQFKSEYFPRTVFRLR